jgi:hypothetical protein
LKEDAPRTHAARFARLPERSLCGCYGWSRISSHPPSQPRLNIVTVVAMRVMARTNALFVVVTNANRIRYSHPNPLLVGKPVQGDPLGVDVC